jgi:hypothetical protein
MRTIGPLALVVLVVASVVLVAMVPMASATHHTDTISVDAVAMALSRSGNCLVATDKSQGVSVYTYNKGLGSFDVPPTSITSFSPSVSDGNGIAVAVNSDCSVIAVTYAARNNGTVVVFFGAGFSLFVEIANPTGVLAQFGSSLSLSGDGSKLVVGDNQFDSGGTKFGIAYSFAATNGTMLVAYSSPSGAANSLFGFAVQINESGELVAIGEPSNGNGLVYFYYGLDPAPNSTVPGSTSTMFGTSMSQFAKDNSIAIGGMDFFQLALPMNINGAAEYSASSFHTVPPAAGGSSGFALGIALADSASHIVVSASGSTEYSPVGAVYVYYGTGYSSFLSMRSGTGTYANIVAFVPDNSAVVIVDVTTPEIQLFVPDSLSISYKNPYYVPNGEHMSMQVAINQSVSNYQWHKKLTTNTSSYAVFGQTSSTYSATASLADNLATYKLVVDWEWLTVTAATITVYVGDLLMPDYSSYSWPYIIGQSTYSIRLGWYNFDPTETVNLYVYVIDSFGGVFTTALASNVPATETIGSYMVRDMVIDPSVSSNATFTCHLNSALTSFSRTISVHAA